MTTIEEARRELRNAQANLTIFNPSLERRNAAVWDALDIGVPVRDIVADTQLTRARIYQIRAKRPV